MKIAIPARDLRIAIAFVAVAFFVGALAVIWALGKLLDAVMGQ